MNIDFKKYKRFFAFGCSFTNYAWPTWADLIAFQYPHAEYFNYAIPGMGNIGIAARINEANKRFEFDDSDLVMVMWSTFCREDRWLRGRWHTQGNIYNSDYPDNFVKNFTDPVGYLIRDHSLINLTNEFLSKSKFGSLILKSAPFILSDSGSIDAHDSTLSDLCKLYLKDYNDFPIDLYTYMGSTWGKFQQKINEDVNGNQTYVDSHPPTSMYLKYLESMGIEFSKNIKNLSDETDIILGTPVIKRSELMKKFHPLFERTRSKNIKPLF